VSLRELAQKLKLETMTLYYAARDPRTPLLAKLLVGLVVAYAISPVDLIPDFIPVLGYLDDLVLLPAGIWLALKLIPKPVLEAARTKARSATEQPTSKAAAATIAVVWLVTAALLAWWAYDTFVA
jgi:uncharacterized membrane protein YkvA (DUF1232 family)